MKKLLCKCFSTFCIIAIVSVVFPSLAFADVFDEVAGKAGNIGVGLRQSGYIIAGFGLIAFSVAAIFNKISWKTLAYIMLSCFALTCITFIRGIAMKDGGSSWIGGQSGVSLPKQEFGDEGKFVVETPGDASSVPTTK